ncbi:MAG: hypothetical protein LQ341_007430 [Variospora aurantia]|nr:MAG: hypothetical protein LQ341_007430 [Variospora aurantia]
MKRIYLIDCPGVVPPNGNDTEEDILLRGVVRVENVENPHVYIPAVLKKVKPQHIERTYDVRGSSDATAFLELVARKSGRLLKGGEADVDGVAKMVLNDFLRGKIPWFTPPPLLDGQEEKEKGIEGRKGALGEMGLVRKAEAVAPGDDDYADGVAVEAEAASAAPVAVPEDRLDSVIAEPAVAEIIPENIQGEEEDGFVGFDEAVESEAEVSSDSDNDDNEEEEEEESDIEEGGGTSLLEPDDDLLNEDSKGDAVNHEENSDDDTDLAAETALHAAEKKLEEEEEQIPGVMKRKRKRKG